MIEILLQGGLGNQLFQYATAYALAKQNKCEICVDTSLLDVFAGRDWCRPYALDAFSLQDKIMITSRHHFLGRVLMKIRESCRQHGVLYKGRYVFELKDLQSVAGRKSLILCGYFADARLFSSCRDELLREFAFRYAPNEANSIMLKEIADYESVSVHIRRGDYLNAKNKDVYHHLSREWYQRAIAIMNERINQPRFFFFSDDIIWVKEQFSNIQGAVFVDLNHGKDSYNDMRLMSACKHNIIANSTFSWWGAWLNSNPSKIVVAPAKFGVDDVENTRYRDKRIDSSWICL